VPHVDAGDTAWVLASTALVLFMTPGLAFFYGGMVRRKNVLGMLMQNYVVMGVVSVAWVWLTYSLAFGVDWGGHGLIGTLHFAGLANIDTQSVPGYSGATAQTIPPLVFVIFQMMFAIITVGLITGSSADRIRFGAFVVFALTWSVLVYAPVAHWVFSPTGWLARRGSEDFAGGTVVHINAAMAGVALAWVAGRRKGWPDAADGTAQRAIHRPRRGDPVVRLVRVQCWIRSGSQQPVGSRVRQHEHSGSRRAPGMDRG